MHAANYNVEDRLQDIYLWRCFSFWFLNGNTVNANSQLNFRRLRSLALLYLLVKLKLTDRIFDDFNTLRLVYISAAEIL